MFSKVPVDKSSMTKTSSPRWRYASAKWDPMNPAPPVISTRKLFNFLLNLNSTRGYSPMSVPQLESLCAPTVCKELLCRRVVAPWKSCSQQILVHGCPTGTGVRDSRSSETVPRPQRQDHL